MNINHNHIIHMHLCTYMYSIVWYYFNNVNVLCKYYCTNQYKTETQQHYSL